MTEPCDHLWVRFPIFDIFTVPYICARCCVEVNLEVPLELHFDEVDTLAAERLGGTVFGTLADWQTREACGELP